MFSAVLRCTLALIFVITASCAMAHDGAPMNATASDPPCSHHQPRDDGPAKAPQQCDTCLSSHFVQDSQTLAHIAFVAAVVPTALTEPVLASGIEPQKSLFQLEDHPFLIRPSLRI